MRELLGSITDEKATNGVVIGTSGFTTPAGKFARRNPPLTLLSGAELVRMLNLTLGADWPIRIDRLIVESRLALP